MLEIHGGDGVGVVLEAGDFALSAVDEGDAGAKGGIGSVVGIEVEVAEALLIERSGGIGGKRGGERG